MPPVVIRPIDSLPSLANQRAPSGPDAIPIGQRMPAGRKFLIVPRVVIRPIESLPSLVNQSAPSGPAAMPSGPRMLALAYLKFVTVPPVVIRPIEPLRKFVNQRAPSDPATIPCGPAMLTSLKLADGAAGGDPSDRVSPIVGEPEGPVRPRGDPPRTEMLES